MTVAEAAVILKVSKMTVYRLGRDGYFRTIRVGRSIRIDAASFSLYHLGRETS